MGKILHTTIVGSLPLLRVGPALTNIPKVYGGHSGRGVAASRENGVRFEPDKKRGAISAIIKEAKGKLFKAKVKEQHE